jgi:hypothetical protein
MINLAIRCPACQNLTMRPQRQMGEGTDHQVLALGPLVSDRVELFAGPTEDTISHFVMTRGAEQAWSAINRQLSEEMGALFWLGGPAASGKTHFLNYVIALGNRTGGLGVEPGRRLTLALDASVPRVAMEPERVLADLLARELGDDRAAGALWRRLPGPEALRVVLDQARRRGLRALTVAIDLGDVDPAVIRPSFQALAALTTGLSNPQLIILVAGRGDAPASGSVPCRTDPASNELAAVALGRARRLDDVPPSTIMIAYGGLAAMDADPAQIYPFHPASVAALLRLGGPARRIPTIARVAREALLAWQATSPRRGLIEYQAFKAKDGAYVLAGRAKYLTDGPHGA